jgi:CPA2 family monovalent cation:H+ antiporter-2
LVKSFFLGEIRAANVHAADMHDLPLITTIATAFTAAWLLGLLTQRLGLSPIVGYLLAGVLIGPHTPGFEADVEIAHQLAEVGVILLMFGVGLHFHFQDLLAVQGVAIPGAIGQSLVATALGVVVFAAFGLPLASGAVIGMAMAVASTVVLMRVLMDADMLNSPPGHVAVGWLLVEDVFTVIVLVLIPVLGSGGTSHAPDAPAGLWPALGLALAKLAVLVAIVMLVGSRVIPWVLVQVARLRSRELFTLTVLVFSIAIAAASYAFFGASMALGAFLAGMMVALSPVSHQAAADALPLRDAFSVLFFVSVGMLFDPAFIIQAPLMIVAAMGIILIAKPLAALAIVALLGHSARTALTVALGLAQIGEFSFILSDLARRHGLMPDSGHNVLVAAAIISITINPILFRSLLPLEAWLRRHRVLWSLLNGRAERRARNVNLATEAEVGARHSAGERLAIVVGFGPVGRSVHSLLDDAGLTTVVIDLNMDTVSELSSQGRHAVFGDASHESILEQAGMRHASHLVVTLPHSSGNAVVAAARNLNAKARILVRAHYLREREDLEAAGATAAVFEEAEVAVALARLVMSDTGTDREFAERKVRDLRLQLILENMSNIHTQRVRSVMVPWTRVHRLSTAASRQDVLRQVAQQHYSRWPVLDREAGRVAGYLLTKDLVAQTSTDQPWTRLVRPLGRVRSDADIESTLLLLQSEGATILLVEESGSPVGLITLEDILEQVFGRFEDEYPHAPTISLPSAIEAGGVVLELFGRTRDEVITELAAAIRPDRLPPEVDIAQLALTREEEVSTDLGVGIAVPHARCANLRAPLVVFGRSDAGISFSEQSVQPVRFVFLLVSPSEQPDVQLALLAQIARIAGDESARERLGQASSESEVLDILSTEPELPAPADGRGHERHAELQRRRP